MPIMLVTAVTKASKKALTSGGNYGPFGAYDCPVQVPHPQRQVLHLYGHAGHTDHKPLHWTLEAWHYCVLPHRLNEPQRITNNKITE